MCDSNVLFACTLTWKQLKVTYHWRGKYCLGTNNENIYLSRFVSGLLTPHPLQFSSTLLGMKVLMKVYCTPYRGLYVAFSDDWIENRSPPSIALLETTGKGVLPITIFLIFLLSQSPKQTLLSRYLKPHFIHTIIIHSSLSLLKIWPNFTSNHPYCHRYRWGKKPIYEYIIDMSNTIKYRGMYGKE